MEASAAEFVRAHTTLGAPPFLPELRLHLAADAFGLWEETERRLGVPVAAPPFWAFPWAGGQALARHVLDHPEVVAGRRGPDLAPRARPVAAAGALTAALAAALARRPAADRHPAAASRKSPTPGPAATSAGTRSQTTTVTLSGAPARNANRTSSCAQPCRSGYRTSVAPRTSSST